MRLVSVGLAVSFLLGACGGSVMQAGGGDAGGPGPDGHGPGTGADAAACPSVVANLKPITPTVMLLLDQSGSMTSAYGGGLSRYQAMTKALADPTTGIVKVLEGQVKFGATLYTSNGGNAGGTCPILTGVNPAMNNYAAIAGLLDANAPAGDTPTGESITAITAGLQAIPPNPDGTASPMIIVLATDGEPDTCAVPNPQNGQPEAIAAAQAAYAAGIKLFILGVGSDVGAPHLQDMANAGAGNPIGGATNAPYYQATDPASMVMAFQQIINGVRTCTFSVSGTVDLSLAHSGTVILNGMPLVYQGANGWHMLDEHTMELDGDACQQFLSDPSVILTATFPCGVIIG